MSQPQQFKQKEDIHYWLALSKIPGLGNKSILKLLEEFSPQNIFSATSSRLSELGLKESVIFALKNFDWNNIEPGLAWLEQSGNQILTINDSLYPEQLKQIDSPPVLLFVRGNTTLLAEPQIAIAGSRNPSSIGRQTAMDFAESLASAGFSITSGMALGIDAAAHQGALKCNGHTIAVAGTGLDRVYPARHRTLAHEIATNGCIISEFPPGTPAKANHFPRRNRIISGLCKGLLIVEAAQQSGSLITARLALEQNREVFAIPGSIHNPLARGCNALIRQGAKLVETCEDILEELGLYNQQFKQQQDEKKQTVLDLEQQNLLNLVQFSPTSIDYLVKESGLTVESVSSMLLILELQGCITSAAGGNYIRIT